MRGKKLTNGSGITPEQRDTLLVDTKVKSLTYREAFSSPVINSTYPIAQEMMHRASTLYFTRIHAP